ncbi:aspartyl-phosphate phosphatase Spo0E family protein [Paenibacillus melissococcoides]|uniref:Aspartyl-phosphate phosphatase Spo0E family protein n=2 Tax=Paenibacillus TaxID=44249 RepID=A0ABM9FUS2_9BACL|nr:aspartyl-phosphate phosphatase Spo0E family protein [Paenibacillus melissococcoides]CAH8703315.1 aspartyl-phosphate phosphatase Spo0E family protein [Paenibacillus melissococcoides]CAH8706129.1 aspartyl-phosphate phosphatase Spo0E family protein [Paenibacillus melissococcoides]
MYGTTDPVVLDKSIELDRMLNKFQSSNFKDGEDNITLMRG